MTKVYPNASAVSTIIPRALASDHGDCCQALTVWKKSLLFNCDGFTVFDAKGNLVFRVDNYGSAGRAGPEIVLMDASGKCLLTIRRKRLSLSDNWLVFEGETTANPMLSVRKHVSLLTNHTRSCLAHVTLASKGILMYQIEGSYAKRCCAVYDGKRRRVAEIRPKEAAIEGVAFGLDVFRLVILQPDLIDSSVVMSLVILLDQMFGSLKRN